MVQYDCIDDDLLDGAVANFISRYPCASQKTMIALLSSHEFKIQR